MTNLDFFCGLKNHVVLLMHFELEKKIGPRNLYLFTISSQVQLASPSWCQSV